MSVLRQLFVIGLLAALGYGLWNAEELGLLRLIGQGQEDRADNAGAALSPEDEGVPVTLASVRMARDETVIEAVGSGLARKAITLYPSVSGEVSDVLIDAGDRVALDQDLVRLDDRKEQLALDLALVAVRDAQQTLKRFAKAVETGAVSEAEVDAARTALDRARLQRDQAEVALDDRTLQAPFAGIVGIARVEPGDRVTSDTAIVTLDDREVLLIDFEVPEAMLSRIDLGHRVRATTWSLPDATFTGTISAIESRVDSLSRTVRVRARLPNAQDRLRPGMSFAVYLDLPGGLHASVPEVAVLWGRDGSYLWRAQDGTARKQFVTIIKRGKGRVLVDGSLDDGDEIVVEGVQRMREGVRLSVSGRMDADASGTDR